MKKYLPRLADDELRLRLEAFGATLIVGPKWCGKTTTAQQVAKSSISLQNSDMLASYQLSGETKPSLLLAGEKPRLLDEWQVVPQLWDAVRHEVDSSQSKGLFVLTGSNAVDETKISHTGIGRISRMKMYPMSLFESDESNGTVSLTDIFAGAPAIEAHSDLSVEQLIFATCRGGWPSSLDITSDRAKLLVAQDYVDGICQTEISSVDGTKRDVSKTRVLLRSYARNVATLAKNSNILADINANGATLSVGAMDSYINALERLFVVEDIPAWCPAIRSASAIRSGKKRLFVDPSIAVASLGVEPQYFWQDLKTFGFMFENLCARDLKVYSQKMGGALSYYHDRYGLEADFVLHLKDGRYALIECKLGTTEIEQGAQHLLKLQQLLQQHNEGDVQCPLALPSALIVLTGGQISYRRADGVYVIAIGCLRD